MWLGILALLVEEFFGGAIIPLLVKVGVGEFSPLLFTFLRFFIATIVFLPFFLRTKPKRIHKKEFFSLLGKSIFFALNATLFGIGIQFTSVIMSMILYSLTPVVVLILAYIFLREQMTKQKIAGLFIAFIGVLFLIYQSAQKSDVLSFGTPLGNILILSAVFFWSLYYVVSKDLHKKYTTNTITFYNMLVGTLFLFALLPLEFVIKPFDMGHVTMLGIGSLLAMGIITSLVMASLLQIGIKRTTAFQASLFNYMGPFFAAVTAIPLFGEKVTPELVFGGLCIIGGVFYATTFEDIKKRIHSVIK